MYFISDNAGPVAPEVMAALAKANTGYAMPYGDDGGTLKVRDLVREIFEAPQAAVHLVATGTAANALSLATLANPWEVIYCHQDAHTANDECNAPEFFTGGAKFMAVSGSGGKIDPVELDRAMAATASKGLPEMQSGPLTVAQVTEAGTVYNLRELAALTDIAKRYNAHCHMDGARFANAVAALGCTPAELTWKIGVDALSFGGTKNGLMGVEAVLLFDPEMSREFELRRKRGAHLFSKNRFLAAQMTAYLTDGLWLKLAAKANRAAEILEQGILNLPGGVLLHPRQANMLFCGWHRAGHKAAQAAGTKYYIDPHDQTPDGPDDGVVTARLVCNWATTDDDIRRFLAAAKG